jgi:hypothetical protein
LTGDDAQVTHRLTSLVMLPIQPSLRGSNFAPLISGSSGMVRPNVARTAPSRGAAVERYITALRLPAPGMFCGTMVGCPRICAPMWRARRRA